MRVSRDSGPGGGAPARPLIAMADGVDGPLLDPEVLARAADLVDPEIILGWVVRTPSWLEPAQVRPYPVTTLLVGAGTRAAVEEGRVRAVATRLSAMPGLLAGRLRPAVAVIGAHADGRGWRLGGSPGWALAAARHATAVIIEQWSGPPPRGAPLVEGKVIDVVPRTDPPDPPPRNRFGSEHGVIGELVAGLVPEGATIQWGPGVVGASVVAALTRPVKVRSGLVTDELCDLARRGLLMGVAEAAYVWGGSDLKEMIGDGSLVLRGVDAIHDITAISGTDGFVAINTALQVGLDGAVNVEAVGGAWWRARVAIRTSQPGHHGLPGGCQWWRCPRHREGCRPSWPAPTSSPPLEATSTWWSPSTVSPTCAASTTPIEPSG